MIKSYIKRHLTILLLLIFALAVYIVIFFLYNIPIEPMLYSALLIIFAFSVFGGVRYVIYRRKHKHLTEMKSRVTIHDINFPSANDIIEQDYQELIYTMESQLNKLTYETDRKYSDMIEYYTMWAHQIKTPVAAMQLILQTEDIAEKGDLQEQLFRIEQYIEMVLHYIRIEDMSGDLILKQYNLNHIVKSVVKKYKKIFIRKNIKLEYIGIDKSYTILTDEKWLTFVIEQLLSNALKYTANGNKIEIITEDNKLQINDTGIGIQAEDLPRIFEKGYTGYNGRADKKSTGIGLHLCKRILTKLSHKINITSEVGIGTNVTLDFTMTDINFDKA